MEWKKILSLSWLTVKPFISRDEQNFVSQLLWFVHHAWTSQHRRNQRGAMSPHIFYYILLLIASRDGVLNQILLLASSQNIRTHKHIYPAPDFWAGYATASQQLIDNCWAWTQPFVGSTVLNNEKTNRPCNQDPFRKRNKAQAWTGVKCRVLKWQSLPLAALRFLSRIYPRRCSPTPFLEHIDLRSTLRLNTK